jgi:hypothetical protein
MILASDLFFGCCSSIPSAHCGKLLQNLFHPLKSLVELIELPAQIALYIFDCNLAST